MQLSLVCECVNLELKIWKKKLPLVDLRLKYGVARSNHVRDSLVRIVYNENTN